MWSYLTVTNGAKADRSDPPFLQRLKGLMPAQPDIASKRSSHDRHAENGLNDDDPEDEISGAQIVYEGQTITPKSFEKLKAGISLEEQKADDERDNLLKCQR